MGKGARIRIDDVDATALHTRGNCTNHVATARDTDITEDYLYVPASSAPPLHCICVLSQHSSEASSIPGADNGKRTQSWAGLGVQCSGSG